MDIILDSNIFRGDITLRSKEFLVLLDYLSKTGSSIVVPEIILDEIKGLYERALNERKFDAIKSIKNFNLLFTDRDKHIVYNNLNIVEELKSYEEFVREKLNIHERNIIPYNNNFLPLIAKRAINRMKPAGEKGQGFRDTLIWLTMKDYCTKCLERQITFISNNSDDFASQDKLKLHETLEDECKELNIKINYFKTLNEFIEKHSTKIDFITYDWLRSNIDNDAVHELVLDYLNETEHRNIISKIEHDLQEDCLAYTALNFIAESEDNLFVYEMSDNRLIVNISIAGYIEFEAEIETFNGWNMDYNEKNSVIRNVISSHNVEIYLTIILVENKISEYNVTDFYI